MAGHGIRLSNSIEKFNQLIEKLKIPVLHTWSAIDVMSSDNKYNFGCSGIYGQRAANFIVQNCDLLIVLGSRLALPQTSYNIDNFAPNAKIIMVNNDLFELQKHSRYNVKVHSDCKYFLDRLYEIQIDSFAAEVSSRGSTDLPDGHSSARATQIGHAVNLAAKTADRIEV